MYDVVCFTGMFFTEEFQPGFMLISLQPFRTFSIAQGQATL